MDTRILTATTESAGARLDAFLAAQLPGVTRSAAARLIEGGCVTVDGRPAGKAPGFRAAKGFASPCRRRRSRRPGRRTSPWTWSMRTRT